MIRIVMHAGCGLPGGNDKNAMGEDDDDIDHDDHEGQEWKSDTRKCNDDDECDNDRNERRKTTEEK